MNFANVNALAKNTDHRLSKWVVPYPFSSDINILIRAAISFSSCQYSECSGKSLFDSDLIANVSCLGCDTATPSEWQLHSFAPDGSSGSLFSPPSARLPKAGMFSHQEDIDFFFFGGGGGGGGSRILKWERGRSSYCGHIAMIAHHEREARCLLRPVSRALEALGFSMLSRASWALFWRILIQNWGGGGGAIAMIAPRLDTSVTLINFDISSKSSQYLRFPNRSAMALC